jgi:hypothetical protein
MCHHQGASLVTLLNYLSTITALFKINKIFKTLHLSNVIKRLLVHEVCMVAVYTICVLKEDLSYEMRAATQCRTFSLPVCYPKI